MDIFTLARQILSPHELLFTRLRMFQNGTLVVRWGARYTLWHNRTHNRLTIPYYASPAIVATLWQDGILYTTILIWPLLGICVIRHILVCPRSINVLTAGRWYSVLYRTPRRLRSRFYFTQNTWIKRFEGFSLSYLQLDSSGHFYHLLTTFPLFFWPG